MRNKKIDKHLSMNSPGEKKEKRKKSLSFIFVYYAHKIYLVVTFSYSEWFLYFNKNEQPFFFAFFLNHLIVLQVCTTKRSQVFNCHLQDVFK